MNNEKLLKKIEQTSTEEYKSQLLHLNGTIDKDTFNAVIEYINEHGLVDSDIAYRNEQLHEKFIDVFHYTDTVCDRNRCEIRIDPTVKFFKRIDKC